MRSDFQSSIEKGWPGARVRASLRGPRENSRRDLRFGVALVLLLAAPAFAQLPNGPGKEQTQRLCSQCHELERSISPRQYRDGWQATLDKMASLGMKASAQDIRAVLDYLSKNYPGEAVPRIDVNHARAIELESGLTLRRSEAAAVIQYRDKHGPFQSIDDLKKVPGIDPAKIEAKKDRLVFKVTQP